MPASVTALRAWLGERYLKVATLDPPVRRLTVVGLVVTATAAAAMVVGSLTLAEPREFSCGQDPVLPVVLAVVALTAVAVGSSVLGLAGRAGGWRFPRVRLWTLAAVPLLMVASQLIGFQFLGGSWQLVGLHTRAAPLFLGLVAPLAVMVATRGRGPRNPYALVATLTAGFGGLAISLLAYAVFAGSCPTVLHLRGALGILGFTSVAGGVALLIWLASEGLRLSGELGVWAMARVPAGRLLVGVLGLKLVLVVLALAVLGPDEFRSRLGLGWPALLFAVPLVLIVALLLVWENRLVAMTLAGYAVVSRTFLLVVTATVSPIVLIGVVTLFSGLPQWPTLALALFVVVGSAVISGVLLRRRPGRLVGLVVIGAACLSYLLLLWALRAPRPLDLGAATAEVMNQTALGLLLAVPALLSLLVVGGLLLRRRHRRYLPFFLAFLLWLTATQVAPLLSGGRTGTTPLAVDAVLTVAVALLGVAYLRGWQRSISAPELVLLLITSSVIVEVPFLAKSLPAGWSTPLTILAYLTPALTALTLSAGPLNVAGPQRSARVLAIVSTLCLGYGALTGLAVVLASPLDILQNVAGYLNGLIALPFAVVLVAVTSAALYPERPVVSRP